MCAATGREIKLVNFDDADAIADERFFPERHILRLLGSQKVCADDAIIEDDFIGEVLGAADRLGHLIRLGLQREIYLGRLIADAEAARLGSEEAKEGLLRECAGRCVAASGRGDARDPPGSVDSFAGRK